MKRVGSILRLAAVFAIGFVAVAEPAWPQADAEVTGLVAVQPQAQQRLRDTGTTEIVVDPAGLAQLSRRPARAVVRDLPLPDGSRDTFSLEAFDVFSDNAVVEEFDGSTHRRIPVPDVAMFLGTALSDPGRTIVLGVTGGTSLRVVVQDDHEVTAVIGPRAGARASDAHEMADHRAIEQAQPETVCAGKPIPPPTGASLNARTAGAPALGAAPGAAVRAATGAALRAATGAALRAATGTALRAASDDMLETEMFIDVGNDLYTNQFASSSAAAGDYVGELIGAVSAIYQRDLKIRTKILQLVIWTSEEPFSGTMANQQYNRYSNYNFTNRKTTPHDVFHYLAGLSSQGGIANLGGVCEWYGAGVSNLDGIYTFPVAGYVWDVNVVAHEVGHNFGSDHTHCYSPPIDHCWNSEIGCYNGAVEPGVGETMSYCHIFGSVDMGFRGRVGDVIRTNGEAAACLSAKASVCGDGVVDLDEECDDGDLLNNDCCSSTCELLASVPGGCADGEFCTEDYECADSSCYHQPRRCDDGNECTQDFCEEGSSACAHHDRAAPCDDGQFCTTNDTCSGGVCSGVPGSCSDESPCTTDACNEAGDFCTHTGAAPSTQCLDAPSSDLRISLGSRPKLSWKWGKGGATEPGDFGSPSSSPSADYALCVYDGAGQLLTHLRAPAMGFCGGRACWRARGNGGFKYRDIKDDATPDGIIGVLLKPGADGRPKMSMRGEGPLLAAPALPVSDVSDVRVQLRRAGATQCWESTFSPPFIANDLERFRDKNP